MVKTSSEQYLSKKLVNAVMDSHTTIVQPVKAFTLNATSEFASRSLNVFSQLKLLENHHENWICKNETHDSFDLIDVNTPVSSQIFKKPSTPISKQKKVFKMKKNMKKWIKYSLKDIPVSSDATNAAVALQFLKDLRKKKELKVNDSLSSSEEKIKFCKPITKSTEAKSDHGMCHHSKFKKAGVKHLSCTIKLDHLEDW